jgi:hypothetical protein
VCETLSLPLKEEHTLNVFENWRLRKIVQPKREKSNQGLEKVA